VGVFVHLCSTLEETGVKVEHISRIGLTTWRATEQERHLTIRYRLLTEIIVEDDSMAASVTEILADGAA
jgi:hypothetical protein